MLVSSRKFGNDCGSALIFVVSLAIILNIVLITVSMTVMKTQKFTGTNRLKASSLLLAEAGKEKLYAELSNGAYIPKQKQIDTVCADFALGAGTFTVSCSSNANLDTVWIESWGKDGKSETGIAVVAALIPGIKIDLTKIKGALTAKSNVVISGDINIDGLDHSKDGIDLDTKDGVLGISTGGTVTIKNDKSETVTCKDGAIYKYGLDAVLQNDETLKSDEVFESPEAFLGLPSGALEEFKQLKYNPSYNGIQYLESMNISDLGNSSGILIVHNDSANATISINGGTFRGLIIVDGIEKFNGNAKVIGAVVALGDKKGLELGNGTAEILYCSEILNELVNYFCKNDIEKVKELSWREISR